MSPQTVPRPRLPSPRVTCPILCPAPPRSSDKLGWAGGQKNGKAALSKSNPGRKSETAAQIDNPDLDSLLPPPQLILGGAGPAYLWAPLGFACRPSPLIHPRVKKPCGGLGDRRHPNFANAHTSPGTAHPILVFVPTPGA